MRSHFAWLLPSLVPLPHSPARFFWKQFITNHFHINLQGLFLRDPTSHPVTLGCEPNSVFGGVDERRRGLFLVKARAVSWEPTKQAGT